MVIALDRHKKPAGFITEERARKLMDRKRACVYRYFPFTVILTDKDIRDMAVPTFRIKVDPGSMHTGIAIVGNGDNRVYYYMQIEHRADRIVQLLKTRSESRRNRRQRETLYRRPKWGKNPAGRDGHIKYSSPRVEGWLPPSTKSIGDNILTWVRWLKKLIPITECSFEAVRFDSQLMDNPDIEGMKYQQGTLMGQELREYLMERYHHTCQYCGGESGDPVLEWEHKVPRSRGGSDSVKNATLSCSTCNRLKGSMTPEEWLAALKAKKKPSEIDGIRMGCIQDVIDGKTPKGSNRYSAWVTSTRRYIEAGLFEIFSEGHVECSSGGRTKYNRTRLGLSKDHHYDALCVGTVPEGGYADLTNGYVLYAAAKGRGSRLRGNINGCGIITTKYRSRTKVVQGFRTGDLVRAVHPDKSRFKLKGTFTGRVEVRSSGSFSIRLPDGSRVSTNARCCEMLQHDDGFEYENCRSEIHTKNVGKQKAATKAKKQK